MCKMSRRDAGKLGFLASKKSHERKFLERIAKYEEHPNRCTQCGSPIEYRKRWNKFCSQRCSARHNNSKREKKKVVCLCCGEIIYDLKFWRIRKYCSRKCQTEFTWAQKKKKILSCGRAVDHRHAKRFLEESSGRKCTICGISEWMGKAVLLILDHKDGNAEDYSIKNLRLVCSNCDAQLPTYKGRNRGRGRYSRRARYSEGKSY